MAQPKVSNRFVRELRKVILASGDTERAEVLLVVLRDMQAGNYEQALDYAKQAHKIDLLDMFITHGDSGALASSWRLIERAFKNKKTKRAEAA